MIPLSKETIDNIFEPRRPIRTAAELQAAVGRLLTDGKQFFCLNKERHSDQDHGRYTAFYFRRPNRIGAEWEVNHYRGTAAYKKGTYPAWAETDGERYGTPWSSRPYANLPCFECLPEPITQAEILLAFYHIAFPDYDDIVKIESWPTISKATWTYIWNKFAAFDRRMFPDVMAGGAWALGCGFSADRERSDMPDWRIDTSTCKLAYKSTPYYFEIRRSDYGEPPETYSSFYPTLIWNGGLYDRMEDTEGMRYRKGTLEEAQAACEQRAGRSFRWAEMPLVANENGFTPDGLWQSEIINPFQSTHPEGRETTQPSYQIGGTAA